MKKDLSACADTELLSLIVHREDAMRVLLARYLSVVQRWVNKLSVPLEEQEDACQEGLMAVLDASRHFSTEQGCSFATYADVCIKNRLISLLRERGTWKRRILTQALSNDMLTDTVVDSSAQLEETVLHRVQLDEVKKAAAVRLTARERQVLLWWMEGYSYDEIAQKMDTTVKSVNNSMQRVRKKLRQYQ